MKKKILITGGNGFLGKNLALNLKKNYKVFIGSRNNGENLKASYLTNTEFIPLDVSNINSVRDALNISKPEIIIHAAATKFVDLSENYPFECVDVNIVGSANIARASIEKNIKTVIGISTDKSAQPIENIYGHSKAVMERIFVASNYLGKTNFFCLRFGNIAWSTGSVFPIWKKMMQDTNLIKTTGPFMRRFFFTIDDAVNFVDMSIIKRKKFSGKIVCPDMKSSRMIDILKVWSKSYKVKYKIISKRRGDKIDETLISSNEIEKTEIFKFKNKKYFVIDFKSDSKNFLKKSINSYNSKKLNKKEIFKLLSLGLK